MSAEPQPDKLVHWPTVCVCVCVFVCVCVCVEHLSQLCSYEIYAVLVAWKQAYHGKQDFYCSFKIIQTVFKQIGWSNDSIYLNESVVTNLI